MSQNMFEGEALGEFYVENRPQPLAGTIRLKNGASPELTLVGHLTDDWVSRVSLSGEPPSQEFLFGRMLRPDTNRTEDLLLVDARCHSRIAAFDGTVTFSKWSTWFALTGPDLTDMARIDGVDISLYGFSEANEQRPASGITDDYALPSELLGSTLGVNIYLTQIASRQRGSGYSNSSWESILRIELDQDASVREGPKYGVAMLSAYALLSGEYRNAHWLAVSMGNAEPLSRRWGSVYGNLGVLWSASSAERNYRGFRLTRAEDKSALVKWLQFFFEESRIARSMLEALQFASLAQTGTVIDRAGLLVRLGYLSEALYGLSRSFPVGPTQSSKKSLLDQLTRLVEQLELHLSCAVVDAATLDHWKKLRHMSAHPKSGEQSPAEDWKAIWRWTAVLNAWLLMYLGASSETTRQVLAQRGLLPMNLNK